MNSIARFEPAMAVLSIATAVLMAGAISPPPRTQPAGKGKMPRLIALSTVPLALGAYAPAVQMAGKLSDPHAVLLQCSTYLVAVASVGTVRMAAESSISVTPATWRAGIELGLWISFAAILEILGLQRTTAARAGFLVRLSTVIVPLADAVLRQVWPSRLVGTAVGCSLIGVVLMVFSPEAVGSTFAGSTLLGDGLMALAALFYSGHIVRLSMLAPKFEPWSLATAKSLTQLTCCAVPLALLAATRGAASALLPMPTGLWKIALFTGTVTCAFPMWAQGFGQQVVRASHVSLIYAMAPVWNAIIARLLLGQHLRPRAFAGALFVCVGMVISIIATASDSDDISAI